MRHTQLGAILLSLVVWHTSSMPSLRAQQPCPSANLPAYAHNDYDNDRPLLDALALGFRGVEVDLFLVGDFLRVGHDHRQAARGPSFEQAYLAPLRQRFMACSKSTEPSDRFLLAIEIKQSSPPTWAALRTLLDDYAELFAPNPTDANTAAPVEIVLVGWHPPLDSLADPISSRIALSVQHRLSSEKSRVDSLDPRVRLLSLDYGKTMGRWWRTESARQRWLDMLRAARAAAPDRLIRVHNVPANARIYDELRGAGVDLLGSRQLRQTHRLLTLPPSAR